jgi:hypothetical protein
MLAQMKEVLEKYLEDEDDMLDMNLTARSGSSLLSANLNLMASQFREFNLAILHT